MYFFQFSLLYIFCVQFIAFEVTFMWSLPIGTFSLFIFAFTVRHVGYSGPCWCCFFILDIFGILIRLRILLCILILEHPIPFIFDGWKYLLERNRRLESCVSKGRSIPIGRQSATGVCVRGLSKTYPTFGREKFIFTPVGLQP